MFFRFAIVPLLLSLLLITSFSSNVFAMSNRPVKLDTATRECVGCHNMEVGKHFGPSHTAHIVGTDYVAAAKRNPTLVPPASLDAGILLVNGNVSCITCHTEYDPETHKDFLKDRDNAEVKAYPMLRVDNTASGLCLKCHRK